MNLIETVIREDARIVKFNNGITNAISFEFVRELTAYLTKIENQSSAIVFTGNSKFFSIGWNLPELVQYDWDTLSDFILSFQNMMLKIATIPVPTVCAIDGHAVAGGIILALGCDYRIARASRVKVGLNESRLGVPIPWIADLILKQLVGYDLSRKISYEGQIMNAEDALALGVLDEVLAEESVLETAVQKASDLRQIPADAFAAIKQSHYEDVVTAYHARVNEKTEQFLDIWFEDETQSLLRKATEKF